MQPLLSFGLGAYNQERFVADAVAAALGQTYSPLQVILSDDCSNDHTFDIMQDMVNRYHGPHQVVLNRNPTNLGLSRHINKIVALAKGELIVAASGDDVSLPERTAALFEAWNSTGRKATYVYSRTLDIDEDGKQITHPIWRSSSPATHRASELTAAPAEYLRSLKPGVCGAAGAYAPRLFQVFGNLPADLTHEDEAMTFRSLLAGSLLQLDTPLVKYRLHGQNLFNTRPTLANSLLSIQVQEDRRQRNFRARARMYSTFREDLRLAQNRQIISEREYSELEGIAQHQQGLYELQGEFMNMSLRSKVSALLRLRRAGAGTAQLKDFLIRLLPWPIFRWTKLTRGYLCQVIR